MSERKTKILVVDDDKEIRQLLSIVLGNEGYEIAQAENGQQAIDMFDESIDLILLDVMMPVKDGISTCTEIRKASNVPIIFLTAKDTELDQIVGLSVDADDYITKPFKPALLSARIRTVLRRSNQPDDRNDISLLKIRDLELNQAEHKVTNADELIRLTPIEFNILALLMRNAGRVFSIDQIYNLIWDEPYMKISSNTVMVHIRKLREKLERDAANPEYLKTEWGVGYKVE